MQTSGRQKKIKPIEVVKILGEGSQGVVALCRFKESDESPVIGHVGNFTSTMDGLPKMQLPAASASNFEHQNNGIKSRIEDAAKDNGNAFVVKLFQHDFQSQNEEPEVRDVRLQNIENENMIMVSLNQRQSRILSFVTRKVYPN